MGVMISEEEVDVIDGKAATVAWFGIHSGTDFGNYELPIIARNTETGEVIGEGIIPFQVVPSGVSGC